MQIDSAYKVVQLYNSMRTHSSSKSWIDQFYIVHLQLGKRAATNGPHVFCGRHLVGETSKRVRFQGGRIGYIEHFAIYLASARRRKHVALPLFVHSWYLVSIGSFKKVIKGYIFLQNALYWVGVRFSRLNVFHFPKKGAYSCNGQTETLQCLKASFQRCSMEYAKLVLPGTTMYPRLRLMYHQELPMCWNLKLKSMTRMTSKQLGHQSPMLWEFPSGPSSPRMPYPKEFQCQGSISARMKRTANRSTSTQALSAAHWQRMFRVLALLQTSSCCFLMKCWIDCTDLISHSLMNCGP